MRSETKNQRSNVVVGKRKASLCDHHLTHHAKANRHSIVVTLEFDTDNTQFCTLCACNPSRYRSWGNMSNQAWDTQTVRWVALAYCSNPCTRERSLLRHNLAHHTDYTSNHRCSQTDRCFDNRLVVCLESKRATQTRDEQDEKFGEVRLASITTHVLSIGILMSHASRQPSHAAHEKTAQVKPAPHAQISCTHSGGSQSASSPFRQ